MKKIFKILEVIKDKEENIIQSAMDSCEEMMLYTDLDGNIYYANKAYADFLNQKLENIIGKKESDFLSDEFSKKCKKNSELAQKHKLVFLVEEIEGKKYRTFKSSVKMKGSEERIFCMIEKIKKQV